MTGQKVLVAQKRTKETRERASKHEWSTVGLPGPRLEKRWLTEDRKGVKNLFNSSISAVTKQSFIWYSTGGRRLWVGHHINILRSPLVLQTVLKNSHGLDEITIVHYLFLCLQKCTDYLPSNITLDARFSYTSAYKYIPVKYAQCLVVHILWYNLSRTKWGSWYGTHSRGNELWKRVK